MIMDEQYYGTAKINRCTTSRIADLERASSGKPLAKKANQRFDTRVSITVTSYRLRLCDSDGVSAKAAIDGLVHCGILQDDSPKFVKEVSYRQHKVGTSAEVKTVIEIEECE